MIRSPVITIMGHVDHGKTTLLDYLRRSRLTAKEQGGITQHIGAYQVSVGEGKSAKKLTFIDTPGHAAFHKMRERGAQVTDIVILVVAANDGVKPQTIESIRHLKNAAVPVVVALNKIDLPDVNVLNIKSQLAEHDILTTDFGGDVEAVEISAKTGQGVPQLLETLVLTAELLELEADEGGPLSAVVIESAKDARRGALASVIVKNGTLVLRQDIFTATGLSGKVRGIIDDLGQTLPRLLPGEPGQILGFKEVLAIGSLITDTPGQTNLPLASKDETAALDFSSLIEQKPKLKFILKADTEGTLEAIAQNFDPDSIDLISAQVGEVSDADVELAKVTGAKILAFQVKTNPRVLQIAKGQDVKIKSYEIIYELIEYIQKKTLKLLEPTIDEVVLGEAEIKQIFVMKGLRIAGVKVTQGEISKNNKLHLLRQGQIIADPVVSSMMHGKQEVSSFKTGGEGGLVFRQKKLDFQVGDVVQAYLVED
jgi:translation initiation factor IF-2